jgi:hypothetical protein
LIPAGLFSGGIKYPEKVEAFIKDLSKELLNTALKALKISSMANILIVPLLAKVCSYLDYLKTIRNEQLSSIINKQFTTILPQLLPKC